MPAATNKADLIVIMLKEHEKLKALLDKLDEATALWHDPEQECSAHEVLAHRAHWIGLFLSWYEDGKAGLEVVTPAPGYKWNQLKAYNAIVYETSHEYSWDGVRECFDRKHGTLMALLESLDDETLYTKHLYPWMNNWTLGRWAEASGSSHYRSAAKVIRKVLKNRAQI